MQELGPEARERYARQLLLPEVGASGQRRLAAARVLCIGAGGLGAPVSLYLAAAGIGTLGIVDDDRVDTSNLQRQVLFTSADVGQLKTAAAGRRLRDLNPLIQVDEHPCRLSADNALDLVGAYDIVVDGSDNFPARYLANDAAVLCGRPLVHASVFRFEGQISVFDATRGPCYRCLFPQPPPAELVPSCAEGGVLGMLPGLFGSLQALEVVKILLGRNDALYGRLLTFDGLAMRWRELPVARDAACPVCGEHPVIDHPAAAAAAGREPEVLEPALATLNVAELADQLASGLPVHLIDVRETAELELARLPGARHIPLGQLALHLDSLDPECEWVVVCQRGPRSERAARQMLEHGLARVRVLSGGIEAWLRNAGPR
ncbi:molybdopterin-synthase adenylyltransferase MoeB [Parahaliea maris]|uniref:Molybdopterin-synthase adenylyltransferase n=1 Tax=Parahaliea maris TaxID=2716870 RepID=A0A5C9A4A8_9GAMM|nr:molybdopterin-synthase adenylyltransferase MoeB [Parahaliea maris]TXS95733.1 molybdopterin-synthase adenylyltransferase MoeB [Parahaliea maris]